MQRPYKKSLQRQISLYFIILTIVIVNTIGWLFYLRSEYYFDEELGQKLVGIAQLAAASTDTDLLQFIQPGVETGQFYASLRSRLQSMVVSFNVERVYIIDRSYHLLVDSDLSTLIGSPIPQLQSNLLELSSAAAGETAYSTLYRGYNGSLYKSGFAPIIDKNTSIAAIACVDASPAFLSVIDNIRNSLLIINLICFIIVLVLSYFLSHTITNPIKKLVDAAKRISSGDYTAPVQIQAKNEIGFLGDVFNTMQDSIRINNENLKSLQQQAENETNRIKSYNELILENIASGIMTLDLKGKITVLNAEAARLLRIDRSENIGKSSSIVFNENNPFQKVFFKLHKNPPLMDYAETDLDFLDESIPVSIRVSPLPDADGTIIGSNWLLVDLSELRNLQTRIKETEWLAYLGELSAAIAHEIRNPLNSINLFLGLLRRRVEQQPGPLESVDKIQQEIESLNTIITDFLYFARPSELQKVTIPVHVLFDNVLFLANQEIEQKKINSKVMIKPKTLTCIGDANQLKQAL
ncbi:MAG: HAMP domain-containing protein, partial [Candidatus Marinimicrobia bacterium]|nr:HAMP domain-containing protein [Candidatus Neomarinimicrobiota bacterium]